MEQQINQNLIHKTIINNKYYDIYREKLMELWNEFEPINTHYTQANDPEIRFSSTNDILVRNHYAPNQKITVECDLIYRDFFNSEDEAEL
ncbi:MAG: hypothetical protein IJV31_07070, partial [Clostridia bacterium]|nr:hypothetical protein [Clostridia bacterium]